jgi:four helix bundle protein
MPFENLEAWKRAKELSVSIYRSMANLKNLGFKDQITRSSLSIPSNIAEGMERSTEKEKARFLEIARGSAAELRTQIMIEIEIEYINKETGEQWLKETQEVSAMLVGLTRSLKSK